MRVENKRDGWHSISHVEVKLKKEMTQVFFVVEHQPYRCSEYPPEGEIEWKEIKIKVEGEEFQPEWRTEKFRDRCECEAHVTAPNSIKFTWEAREKKNV